MPWWKDRTLWAVMVVAAVLRVLPLVLWPDWDCVRDECTYIKISKRMVAGEGMTSSAGWLWAPAYPALMALFRQLTGYSATVKGLQIIANVAVLPLMWDFAKRIHGTQAAGRFAAGLYALSPVLAFFSVTLWSESIYAPLLVFGVWCGERAMSAHGRPGRAAFVWAGVAGATVGICVLFRGVAQYMLPVFAFCFVWMRWRSLRAWGQAAVLVVAAVVTVTPYSAYISDKFDHFIISDRTMGRMAWLGNNDFDPITFDYGNGQLSQRAYKRAASQGRKACAARSRVIQYDQCQTQEAVEWIKANPRTFLARVPMRMAQMLNPHSLFTRHLRWGKWPGTPWWVDELLIVGGALSSIFIMLGGALTLAIRGRGGRALLVGGIVLYHVAAISLLAGLSRYRVPLEPLLLLYAAGLASDPGGTWAAFRRSRWRMALASVVLLALLPLVLWYLPAGWPWWRSW